MAGCGHRVEFTAGWCAGVWMRECAGSKVRCGALVRKASNVCGCVGVWEEMVEELCLGGRNLQRP